MSSDVSKTIFYTGPSMSPVLKAADILQVLPYERKKIQRGDVIVFPDPEGERTVTHRVVRIDSQGIRTRGDNSQRVDSWVLSSDNIVGRVIYLRRGDRRLPVYGGVRGRILAVAVRAIHIIDSGISMLLRPLYRWLARTGAFRRWVPARLKIRVLSFDRPAGTELRLLMGRRVIGRLLPDRNQWVIQRPFRLFVNEASLPRGDRDHSAPSESRAL